MSTATLLFIAFAWGLSLAVNVWIFFRVSGAFFNPAVTLALAVVQIICPIRAVVAFIAQILASITAAGLIKLLTPGDLDVGTRLANGASIPQGFQRRITLMEGLFLEFFMTTQLVLVIFMLGVEKHKSTYLLPLIVGLTVTATLLIGVPFTGASLNPARSFGPDIVTRDFPGYHWIYCMTPHLNCSR